MIFTHCPVHFAHNYSKWKINGEIMRVIVEMIFKMYGHNPTPPTEGKQNDDP